MPSLEAELRSLELYKKKYAVNPSKTLESIIKRQEERIKHARGNDNAANETKSSPTSSGACVKRYVTIKEGCNSVRRLVHKNDANKNYIQMNGKNIYLSSIRGKYRYSDI